MITHSDQLRIIVFLKRLGCNKSESLIYIEVLQLGTTSVQELARNIKRNRISVNYSVQQLIEKGFLFEIRKGKKRLITANSSDVLRRIIEQRNTELKSLEKDAEHVSKLIDSIPVIKHEVTVVRLYEEVEGIKRMLEESLQAKSEIMVFSNTPVFSKTLGEDYHENYFARKAALGIHSRVIYSPCAFADKIDAKKDQYKIDLRILSIGQRSVSGSESGFYLWDNILAIKSLKENKISCTMIENKDIASFFRDNIFNPFWRDAKPIGDFQ